MKRFLSAFILFATCSLMAQPQAILRNAMTTNIAGTPVLSRSDLSVTNVGSATNWLFYGTAPNTVARLVDIALGAGTLWATIVSNSDGSVTVYTNTANTGTNIYGLSSAAFVNYASNSLQQTTSNNFVLKSGDTMTGNLTLPTAIATSSLIVTGSVISGNSQTSTVVNAQWNTLDNVSVGATISGGEGNSINGTASSWSTIGGGNGNSIVNGASLSTIAGGSGNAIADNCTYGFIGGGLINSIDVGNYGVLAGGSDNGINGGDYNGILSGLENEVSDAVGYSVIDGGLNNRILGEYGSIIGGKQNTNVSGSYSVILGGFSNSVAGDYAVAAGALSAANANGAWMISDSSQTNKVNSTANSFQAKFAVGYYFQGGGLKVEVPILSTNNAGVLPIPTNVPSAGNVLYSTSGSTASWSNPPTGGGDVTTAQLNSASNSLQLSMSNTVSYVSNIDEFRYQFGSANLSNWSTLTTNAYQSIWIDAGAMATNAAGGPTVGYYTATNFNGIYSDVWDFDSTTPQTNYFKLMMPDSWDLATVKIKLFYFTTAVVASTSNVWATCAQAVSTGDLFGFRGTEVSVTNVVQDTTNKLNVCTSPAITVGGTPVLGDMVHFQVRRVADSGWDNSAGNARLLGVAVQWQDKRNNPAQW